MYMQIQLKLDAQQILRVKGADSVSSNLDLNTRSRYEPGQTLQATGPEAKITFFDFLADFFRNSFKLDADGNYYPDADQGLTQEGFEQRNSGPGQKLYLSQDEMDKLCDYLKTEGFQLYMKGVEHVRKLDSQVQKYQKQVDATYKTIEQRKAQMTSVLDHFNTQSRQVFDATSVSSLLQSALMKNPRIEVSAKNETMLRRAADVIALFNTRLSDKVSMSHAFKNSTDDIELGFKSLARLSKDQTPAHKTDNAVIALAEEHTEYSPAREKLMELFSSLKNSHAFGIELPPNYTEAQMCGEKTSAEDAKVFGNMQLILAEISQQAFASPDIKRFCDFFQTRSNIIGDLCGIPENVAQMNKAAIESGIEFFGFDCPEGNAKNRAIMSLQKLVASDKYFSNEDRTAMRDYLKEQQKQVGIERNEYSANLLEERAQAGDKDIITLSGSAHIVEHDADSHERTIPDILKEKKVPVASVAIDHEDPRSPSPNWNFFSSWLNRVPELFDKPRLVLETHYPIARHTSMLNNNNADAFWTFPAATKA